MATFVMVHGAGDGAWAWTPVADRLRQQGHRAFPVTLTGYGDRRHLASPAITLERHVQDVMAVVQYERMDSVWLVGHSYGGWVITAAAEQMADRIAHLVYVDAVIPLASGQYMLDLYDPAFVAQTEQALGPDGWQLPVSPNLITADRRYGPALIRPLRDSVVLANPQAAALPRTYIAYTDRENNPRSAAVFRTEQAVRVRDWRVVTVPGDHNIHATQPDRLASVLDGIARGTTV
ncbi:MAG: alpha/beta hydrolase [Sulfobacillus acidophilus]|uniref:Alpha/beta hydrolase n=1 Tax=Sulfobacillus acidophilus TaxID=53633 RepID=A0A2T2WN35_9FIRM|nr:MAG: alpha/beta hydrolase [Sulfobacillus acidophilus]